MWKSQCNIASLPLAKIALVNDFIRPLLYEQLRYSNKTLLEF